MRSDPNPDTLEAAARQAVPADVRVAADAERCPHPLLPDAEHVYVEAGDGSLRLHAGSFAALAAAHEGVDPCEEVEAHVEAALDDLAEAAPAADDEALFRSHARFRRGEALPHGWYRGGESGGPWTWIVDLDVFVEVWMSRHTWTRVVGSMLPLALGEDVLEVELPADADPADVLTLPGAGLFESEPFEDEPLPPAGDLHLLFFVV